MKSFGEGILDHFTSRENASVEVSDMVLSSRKKIIGHTQWERIGPVDG